MQIQPISNNYQARSQRIQKQNNPSFGATIVYGKNAKTIREVGDNLERLVFDAVDNADHRNFFQRALNVFLQSLRSVATHNRTPENHKLFDCDIPVGEISFRTEDIIWLGNHNLSPQAGYTTYAANHPEYAKMVIETVSGARVEIPFDYSEEEIAKTGERIQKGAISLREQMNPTNSTRTYTEDPVDGQEIKPIQIDTL